MKTSFLRIFSILSVLVLFLQLTGINSAGATGFEGGKDTTINVPEKPELPDLGQPLVDESSDIDQVTPQASKVYVYFKGVVVGALTAGSIIYVSGKAPAEWVSWGLSSIESKIKSFAKSASYVPGKPIYVASNGNISACIVFPCAVATSFPGEEETTQAPTQEELNAITNRFELKSTLRVTEE